MAATASMADTATLSTDTSSMSQRLYATKNKYFVLNSPCNNFARKFTMEKNYDQSRTNLSSYR
jgi:hypothetical protein